MGTGSDAPVLGRLLGRSLGGAYKIAVTSGEPPPKSPAVPLPRKASSGYGTGGKTPSPSHGLDRVNTSDARDWKRYPTAELNPTSDRRLPPKSDPVARAKGIAGKDAPYQQRTPVGRYMCDGTGRDVYLTGQMPTAGVISTAPPPRPFIRAAPPRTVTVPKYRPSGTGRDTFHGVDLTAPKGEFKLRDYEVKGMGLRYGSESSLRGPSRVHGVYSKEAQRRRSASQRSSMARLAAPKGYNEGDPIGTRRQGDWLRKSRG